MLATGSQNLRTPLTDRILKENSPLVISVSLGATAPTEPAHLADDVCAALGAAHGEQAAQYQPFWEWVHRMLSQADQQFKQEELPPTFREALRV